jgi:hypothetical protein
LSFHIFTECEKTTIPSFLHQMERIQIPMGIDWSIELKKIKLISLLIHAILNPHESNRKNRKSRGTLDLLYQWQLSFCPMASC